MNPLLYFICFKHFTAIHYRNESRVKFLQTIELKYRLKKKKHIPAKALILERSKSLEDELPPSYSNS